jgi:hypothetical protein
VWQKTVTWVGRRRWLLAGVFGSAVLVYSKPNDASFKEYLRMRNGGAARMYVDAFKWFGLKVRLGLREGSESNAGRSYPANTYGMHRVVAR